MTFPSQYLSIAIEAPAEQVYEFAANPQNLPQWAAGLSGSIQFVAGAWVAQSPMGSVKVKFAPKNEYGVLDHEVTLPSGASVYNPMRVVPNDDGSEVVFTLYRQPGASDQEFAADAQAVTKDLATLKALLEESRRGQ